MATIQSFTDAVDVLKQNPLLFAVGALYAVIILPQSALSTIGIPIVPQLLQMVTFFVTPFVIAGLLAMSYEGLERPTSLSTFKKVGKDRYLRVLAGNLVRFSVELVFGFVFALVLFFTVGLGMAAAMRGGGDPSTAILGSVGLAAVAAVVAVLLLFLVVMLFLQFYAVAYVVDDVGVIDGFARSVGVVRRNLVSALGFSVLNLVLGVLIVLPAIALAVAPFLAGGAGTGSGMGTATQSASAFETSLLAKLGIIAYSFVVSIVMVPFRSAFSVAFYRNHRSSGS